MILRKLEPTDLPYLYLWENDAKVWADGSLHNPVSQQDLRDYIASTTGDIYRDGQLRLMIEDEGQTIGCIDLFDLDARNRKAAVGMYIAPELRGKGYGRKALELLEQQAFVHLGLRMIYAVIVVQNTVCRALYRAMGYTETATLQAWTLESDAVVYQKINPAL